MIRITFIMLGLLLLAGCAAHREPAANCWQHRVAFVEDTAADATAADCIFTPLSGPSGGVDV